MFSASLEIVLTIAYREALSRRHAYVTLEHLLYALAHDADGERILGACGVDLPKLRRDLDVYLHDSIERVKRGQEHQPEQTAAFARALQTAVRHVQSAHREEVQAGDICAAILQQPKTHAAPSGSTGMPSISSGWRSGRIRSMSFRSSLFYTAIFNRT